jgi:hypothetical protein
MKTDFAFILFLALCLTASCADPGTNTFGVFIDPCCRYEAHVGRRGLDDTNSTIVVFTNVVSGWYHTNDCVLIRYRDTGVTNEFHAWMIPVTFKAVPKTKP